MYEENWWAIETLINLPIEHPELAWSIILRIFEKLAQVNDKEGLEVLAAGPLEDLMCKYGEQIIDRIEIEAKKNSVFKECIKGVWLTKEDTSVQKRFYEIAEISPFNE